MAYLRVTYLDELLEWEGGVHLLQIGDSLLAVLTLGVAVYSRVAMSDDCVLGAAPLDTNVILYGKGGWSGVGRGGLR